MKENSFEKVFYLSYKDLLYVLRLLIHSIDCPDVCAFESKILQQVENGSLLHYIIHMHSSFVLFFFSFLHACLNFYLVGVFCCAALLVSVLIPRRR